MGFGGIIAGAIGGTGAAMQEQADQRTKASLEMQNYAAKSDIDLSRAKALEEAKVAIANQQRELQTERINTAAQPILDKGIVNKARSARANQLPDYDPSDTSGPATFHGDAKQTLAAIQALPDGPDKTAALAQLDANVSDNKKRVGIIGSADLSEDERTRFAPSDSDLIRAHTQAAIKTGDISPTEAAKLGNASEINQMKIDSLIERAQDRNATMKEIADVRADALRYGYELRLQAATEKRLNGKIDTATTRMLITSEDANIRASTSQLNMLNNQRTNVSPGKSGEAQRAQIDSQMEDLRTEIAESKKRKLDLFKSLNIVPKDEDADTPNPAPAPAPDPSNRPPLGSFLR